MMLNLVLNLQAHDAGYKEDGEAEECVEADAEAGAGKDGELGAAGHLLQLPPPGRHLVLDTGVAAGQPLHTAAVCSAAGGAALGAQAAAQPHAQPAGLI